MHWSQHLLFWLEAGAIGTCIALTALSSVRGKVWLLYFLALSLCSYAGQYVPFLVLSREHLSSEAFRDVLETSSNVSRLIGVLGWAFLIRFVLDLRTWPTEAFGRDPVPVSPMTQSRRRRITSLCSLLGGGILAAVVTFGVPPKSIAEAMIKGGQAGVVGAFLGFLVAKVVLAFWRPTPEGQERLRD